VNPAQSAEHLELYKKNIKKIESVFEESLKTARRNKDRAYILEAWVLIFGTIIWAFGDWLVFHFGVGCSNCG
jgi:hypothetical protein